jgi:hypothetical protein
MTVFLNPEDEYRQLKGYPPDYPVPVTMDSSTLPRGEARGMEFGEQCPPVPEGGPGKRRLDAMVADARRIGRIHNPNIALEGVTAGAILAENSKTGGKWDIKNLRDAQGRKLYPKGQEYGDFLYGATSTGMGFSPRVSDLGADLYSLWSNGTFEDKDAWIRAGQRYARTKCDLK